MTGPGAFLLVLLRHGQSEWNAAQRFTGWANPALSTAGEGEARRAGALLAGHGMFPAFAHTSLQRRTIRTAELALAGADRDWIPARRSWRLNGRHYGALQGRSKAEVLEEYGERQFMAWRRSYHAAPPPLGPDAWHSQFSDPRYACLPPEARPRAESLSQVSARMLPYWYDAIVPDLRSGGCVLVISHGNTLRALVKHLDSIPDDRIAELDIPTGIPLAYQLGPDMRPAAAAARYLDPGAASVAIEAVLPGARASGKPPRGRSVRNQGRRQLSAPLCAAGSMRGRLA
ncbi:MAG: 2,3-bisphosphoglycerate-dependent phosphoglycerate mutase [Streptosporangiaceae bacterium]|nr:2,3-bisphosphoglycerate-dependent phosphoglycerate mutase [Streptosporangiaceae bacterium]